MTARLFARAILLGLAGTAAVLLALLLWLLIHAYLIAPGHAPAVYQAYAARVSPYAAAIAGFPIFIGMGWWSARLATGPRRMVAALIPALVYVLIDAAVLALLAPAGFSGWPSALPWLAILAAAAGGGALAAAQMRPLLSLRWTRSSS